MHIQAVAYMGCDVRYYASVLVIARNIATTSHANRRPYVPTNMYQSFAAFFARMWIDNVCVENLYVQTWVPK